MLIDRRGRLLGRVNVIDAVALTAAVLLLVPTVMYAVRLMRAWAVEMTVFSVEPLTAVAGEPQTIELTGRNLGSANRVEFGLYATSHVISLDRHRVLVEIPPEVEPGLYPVTLLGGLGRRVRVSAPMGGGDEFEIVSRPTVAEPVGVTAREPIRILSKPIIHEGIPVMVLCSLRKIGRTPSALNPDWGYETEVMRVKRIAHIPGTNDTLANVFLKVQITIQGADTTYTVTGEPIEIRKRLYLKKRRLTATVLTNPILLIPLPPPQNDGTS